MPLRKKFSRKLLKSHQPPPEERPPIPPSAALLPAVRPSSPLLSSSPLLTSRPIRHAHRRSRSFSALRHDETSDAFGELTLRPLRDSAFSQRSKTSMSSMDQPWRSHDTWVALHNSPISNPSLAASHLTHPSALPDGSGGWRGKTGEGFFKGNKTPRQRSKTLEGESPDFACLKNTQGVWTSRGELMYKLQSSSLTSSTSSRSSAFSTLPRSTSGRSLGSSPLKATLTPSPSPQSLDNHNKGADNAFFPRESCKEHNREESLLPPLLPTTVQKLSRRVTSFASLRSNQPLQTPSFAARDSYSLSSPPHLAKTPAYMTTTVMAGVKDEAGDRLMTTPIPWGGRTISPRRSASPARARVPVPPRSVRRAPQKVLPDPPSIDFSSSSGISPNELVVEMEGEGESEEGGMSVESEDGRGKERDGSVSPIRERLTTPVTPPRPARRVDRLTAKGREVRGKEGMRGSWGTTELGGPTRGGWI